MTAVRALAPVPRAQVAQAFETWARQLTALVDGSREPHKAQVVA